MSSSSELSTTSSWSSVAERIGLLQGRRAILQALGRRSVVSAAAVADEQRAAGGSIRGGAGAVPPPLRRDSSEPAPAPAAAARRRPTGSGTTGGAGSPGDADDALLDAPSPGLTAEMALSILVDCFGQ